MPAAGAWSQRSVPARARVASPGAHEKRISASAIASPSSSFDPARAISRSGKSRRNRSASSSGIAHASEAWKSPSRSRRTPDDPRLALEGRAVVAEQDSSQERDREGTLREDASVEPGEVEGRSLRARDVVAQLPDLERTQRVHDVGRIEGGAVGLALRVGPLQA